MKYKKMNKLLVKNVVHCHLTYILALCLFSVFSCFSDVSRQLISYWNKEKTKCDWFSFPTFGDLMTYFVVLSNIAFLVPYWISVKGFYSSNKGLISQNTKRVDLQEASLYLWIFIISTCYHLVDSGWLGQDCLYIRNGGNHARMGCIDVLSEFDHGLSALMIVVTIRGAILYHQTRCSCCRDCRNGCPGQNSNNNSNNNNNNNQDTALGLICSGIGKACLRGYCGTPERKAKLEFTREKIVQHLLIANVIVVLYITFEQVDATGAGTYDYSINWISYNYLLICEVIVGFLLPMLMLPGTHFHLYVSTFVPGFAFLVVACYCYYSGCQYPTRSHEYDLYHGFWHVSVALSAASFMGLWDSVIILVGRSKVLFEILCCFVYFRKTRQPHSAHEVIFFPSSCLYTVMPAVQENDGLSPLTVEVGVVGIGDDVLDINRREQQQQNPVVIIPRGVSFGKPQQQHSIDTTDRENGARYTSLREVRRYSHPGTSSHLAAESLHTHDENSQYSPMPPPDSYSDRTTYLLTGPEVIAWSAENARDGAYYNHITDQNKPVIVDGGISQPYYLLPGGTAFGGSEQR